jgi:hypothetical protein
VKSQEIGNNGRKIKMTNETQKVIEPRIVPLDVIVQNETIVGFEVNGFGYEFDGDEYRGDRKYLVTPAGEYAPGVFKVTEHGYFGKWGAKDSRESIVSGVENAIQNAYLQALSYASGQVEGHNEWVNAKEENERKIGKYRRAILVDNAKDKFKV